jgi:outer membrane protein OmpA-like peptidoglycan-associated protein
MRNALLTNTMLAMLSIAPLQVMAQETSTPETPAQEEAAQETTEQAETAVQQTPPALLDAYGQYASARQSFAQIQAGNGDVEAAADAVQATRDQLLTICEDLGVPELAACLDQFIAPEMRLPNDLEPIVIEPTPIEAEPEAAAEPEAEVLEAEEAPEMPKAEEEPVVESNGEAEPVAEDEAANADANGAAESETQVETEADAASEQDVVSVDTQLETQSEMAADVPPELAAAYEAYAAARISFNDAQSATNDVAAEADAVRSARQNLEAVCADLGAPDLAACLDQFIPADMRLPNDLAPLEMNAESGESEASSEGMNAQEDEPMSDENSEAAAEQAESEEAAEPVEPVEGADAAPEDVAPVLDSAKEEAPTQGDAEADKSSDADAGVETEADASGEAEVKDDANSETTSDAPPPQNDTEAQETVAPTEMTSINAEEGERVSEPDKAEAASARAAPKDAKVVQENESDFRIVFQFNNQVIVENKDNQRLEQNADETYIERLRNGRTRETIVRADGSEIVTIYNRNGDIVRRSRFTPDGEEYVLVYVDESYEEDLLEWRDPALDLGPLQLDIPVSEYVLDADEANEDELVQFLDQPPVERVQRLYSINEVKRSARVRDMVRRLEVGGLTFETAKATIPVDQISSLTNVANAMLDLLDKNPAETFLIEGHTDAVGGEIYNLELSDRRAETVAVILSQAFGIPPENLATQGYGERYLKVRTQEADRRNRRVTIKRITPLISPVARR